MKAAVLYETNTPLVIDDVKVAKPGPREVLVRTAAAGVCHSDLHFADGSYPYPLPAILGHEFLAERKIQGSRMGSNRFRVDMPRFVDFYLSGKLHLDDMISRRIKLEDVNEGLQALKTGEVARSVIVFD